jgi:sec-independent protein translocase protein TatA
MPFPNIGPGELILILIIALVVLGPGKLPDVASSLGKSVREFRRAASDVADAGKLDPPAATPAAQSNAATPAPPATAPDASAVAPAEAPAATPAEPTEPSSDPNRS